MQDNKFLTAVRMAIAGKGILKKTLARRCRVSRPQFSEMIWGDRVMPPEVRKRLISELELNEYVSRLGL